MINLFNIILITRLIYLICLCWSFSIPPQNQQLVPSEPPLWHLRLIQPWHSPPSTATPRCSKASKRCARSTGPTANSLPAPPHRGHSRGKGGQPVNGPLRCHNKKAFSAVGPTIPSTPPPPHAATARPAPAPNYLQPSSPPRGDAPG